MANPVAGRLQPRSATLPAIGAAIGAAMAPATPASANRAIPSRDSLNSGPASSNGVVVQNRLNAGQKSTLMRQS